MAIRRYSEIDADPVLLEEIREKNGVPDSVIEDATRTIVGIPEPESSEAQLFINAVARTLGTPEPDPAESDSDGVDQPSPGPAPSA